MGADVRLSHKYQNETTWISILGRLHEQYTDFLTRFITLCASLRKSFQQIHEWCVAPIKQTCHSMTLFFCIHFHYLSWKGIFHWSDPVVEK